jgi:hypothetical protein
MIVGVVADYSNSFAEFSISAPKVFVPLAPQGADTRSLFLLARADGTPAALLQPLQRVAREAAPGMTVVDAFTYAQMLDQQSAEWLVTIAPLGPLIVVGVLLTAAGIYGVLAFAIARRTRELAIRVALGATERDQAVLVGGRSARLVAIGAGGATGFALLLAQLGRIAGGAGSFMFPPWTAFVLPVVIMAAVAAIATWLPMRRARKIDPALLLRTT